MKIRKKKHQYNSYKLIRIDPNVLFSGSKELMTLVPNVQRFGKSAKPWVRNSFWRWLANRRTKYGK